MGEKDSEGGYSEGQSERAVPSGITDTSSLENLLPSSYRLLDRRLPTIIYFVPS